MVTNVTRLEITDKTGTVYARHDVRVRLEYEDAGRTLVVHVEDREDVPQPRVVREPRVIISGTLHVPRVARSAAACDTGYAPPSNTDHATCDW